MNFARAIGGRVDNFKVQNASKIITAIPLGENNKRAPLNLGCYGYYIIIAAIKIIVRSKGFKKEQV